MTKEHLSDDDILNLLSMPKRVVNPRARPKTLERHVQTDYNIESCVSDDKFALFVRQSTKREESFSVGLRLLSDDGVTLIRCNGASHPHRNHLEGERFEPQCHIHTTTARYLAYGRKNEGFAEPTSAYQEVQGALKHIIERCNISGFTTTRRRAKPRHSDNQVNLFESDELRDD